MKKGFAINVWVGFQDGRPEMDTRKGTVCLHQTKKDTLFNHSEAVKCRLVEVTPSRSVKGA